MNDDVRVLFDELTSLSAEQRQRCFEERRIPPDVRAEVEELLRFDSDTGHALSKSVASAAGQMLSWAADIGARNHFGPYRLLRLLGHGGMGSVHLAERADGEVEQRVAIKFLRFGSDEPSFRDRFLRERQILAKLSHPGIARLLNAGHTGDGQPYLVMDYIDGVPIDVYASALDLRGKLKLFLQVCDAVSYAHRNLVMHRDLKPSNILVDNAGHPKLLDFGIAKMLDSSLDETQTAERLLTPQYASPEQVNGDAQTTATDIYSLGAVLYKLVTGRSPHEFGGGTREEIIAAISTKTPVAASRLNPNLPSDIEFILGKALRKEPAERYASVDAFADDVQAFLEWRSVNARSGDTWYRLRRFARRYRLAVAAVALTITGLSVGLYIANRERLIAQQRFQQVRQLAKKFIDLDGEIKNLPGSTRVRNRIVSESLEYLKALGEEVRGDPELALEIGHAYLQVARVQGVPAGANLGLFAQAEESLRKADSLVDSALAVNADDPRALLTSAEIAHDRMTLADMQDRQDDTLAQAGKAAGRLDRLLKRANRDPDDVLTAARIYGNIGNAYSNSNRFDDAIRYGRRAAEILGSDEAGLRRKGSVLSLMSASLLRVGDLDGALTAARDGRTILEHSAGMNPISGRVNLINALNREGQILGSDEDISLGRTGDALAAFQRALSLSEELVRNDPEDGYSRDLVAVLSRASGDILRHSNPQAALALYDHALASILATKLNPRMQRDQVELLASSCYAARQLHRTDDARRRIDTAFRILRDTRQYPADKIEPFSEPDHALQALADHYSETGQPGKAVETYREELAKVLAWKADPQNDLRDANRFSLTWAALSRVLRQTGQDDEAGVLEARRAELWKHWNGKLPGNAFVLRQMGSRSGFAGR